MQDLNELFPPPGNEPVYLSLAKEMALSAESMNASPITFSLAAFSAFIIACEVGGADPRKVFDHLMQNYDYTDPHTHGDDTRG